MFSDLLRDDIFRLETARLWLRWPRMGDVQSLVRHAGERQIAAMTASIPHPYTKEDAEKFVFASRAGNAAGDQIGLVITRKGKQAEVIGTIGVFGTRPGHAIFGYWLGQPFHGQGLTGEAAEAMIDLAFRTSEIDMISASALAENAASRKILTHCGFTESAPVRREHRGGMADMFNYSLPREAWAARAAAFAHRANNAGTVSSAA